MNRSPGPTARTRTRSPDGPCESRRSCSRAPSSSVGVGIWPTLRTLSAVCRGSSSLSRPGPAALRRVAAPGSARRAGKKLGIEDTAGDAAGDGHRHSSDVGWVLSVGRLGGRGARRCSAMLLPPPMCGVRCGVRQVGIIALLPMEFHEHPRVAMTNSVCNSGRDSTRPPGPGTDKYRGSSHVTRRRVLSSGPGPDA